ncbi:MAG TPA: rhodanese-like domain-containing protein [Candidatus Hydrogenedentes bacterium]|nr:rhodanese-like domain-containing protein [Candidatus Hydrogenedentota bacterium]HIJ72459.1 rhodanese-like domain-containing protein [Candidatus Hydrogenedentota bacterium]
MYTHFGLFVVVLGICLAAFAAEYDIARGEPGVPGEAGSDDVTTEIVHRMLFPKAYEDVSVAQAHQMWEDETFFLDVRTAAEIDAGYIPGAYNIDSTELGVRLDEIADLQNQDIVVYCKAGGRSAPAAQLLSDKGFTAVHNMLGGFDAWQAAGYEVSGADQPGVLTPSCAATITAVSRSGSPPAYGNPALFLAVLLSLAVKRRKRQVA